MGKIIFWIVVVFAVLFVLRHVQRRQGAASGASRPNAAAERARRPMVRCVQCGVFLPKPEARDRRRRLSLRATPPARERASVDASGRALAHTVDRCSPRPPFRRSSRRRCRLRWAIRAAASCGSSASIARSARAMLLGVALLLDPRTLNVANAERVRHRRPACTSCSACRVLVGAAGPAADAAAARCCSRCLAGDVFFLVARDVRRRHASARRCRSCCSRSSRRAGWMLRTQTAFFHAAFATIVLLGPRRLSRDRGHDGRRAGVPDRHHRLRLLRDGRHRGRARPLHEAVGGPGRAARHRRRQPRAGQPPHHPGHAGRRAGRRPERRRARPQRAGHATARRLRPHARRHAARRVLARRCTTTGGAGRRTSPSRCRRSRSRRRSACCACGSCASAPASTAAR